MRLIIDRIEDGYAVCEDMDTRGTLTYPPGALPEGAKPGDVLSDCGGGFKIDRKATQARRKRIKKMYKGLLKDG